MPDLNQLCMHTITTKPWSLETAVREYAAAGIGGVSVWREALPDGDAKKGKQLIREAGLEVVSYVRGGFFPSLEADQRQAALQHNRTMLEEAAILEAPLMVLVCGAAPGQTLQTSRLQIREALEALLPDAERWGVKLAIEPLHPMYADTRSAVNSLAQANDLAEYFHSSFVGVAVDVYHLWWDDQLEKEIYRCGGGGNLLAYHVCDWNVPTVDMLNDRGLMGEGCIPIKDISKWVTQAGFEGWIEVEIFSHRHWARDQKEFLQDIIKAYQKYV